MNKSTLKYIVAGITGIVLGIFLQLTFSFPIKFDTAISLFDIIELSVTVCLAVYIAGILEKGVQDKRAEKDILLTKVNQIETILQDLDKIEIGEYFKYTYITNRISKAREKKNRFFKLLTSKIPTHQSEAFKTIEDQLKSDFKDLKKLLTESPVVPSNPPDIDIKNGKVKYSEKRVSEITCLLLDIYDKFLELQLILNYI